MFKTELIKITSTLHLTALDALGLLCIDIDIYGDVTSYCTNQTEADQRGEEAAQLERCWRLADRAAARHAAAAVGRGTGHRNHPFEALSWQN